MTARTIRVQPRAAHRSMPWANGGGVTEEIAIDIANEEWSWRLSLAKVVADGPFSVLPGIDRSLVVCDGAGMDLSVAGQTHRIARFDSFAFDGAAPTTCALLDGPIHDLNLMVRADAKIGRPHLRITRLGRGDEVSIDDALAMVVLDGVIVVTTQGTAFPFTPTINRATRFDALLFAPASDDTPAQSVTVLRDCVVALALLDRSVARR